MANQGLTSTTNENIPWPELTPMPRPRALKGTPAVSTVLFKDDPKYQFGLWKVTPGEFRMDIVGYAEFLHVTRGHGKSISDDGEVTPLDPGTTLFLPPGWKGHWVVTETIEKVYTLSYV